MARRSTIAQIAQVRLEATPGLDPLTGTKRLKSLNWDLRPQANILRFRGSASKYASVVSVGQEWSEAALTGVPTYDEVPYVLASAITAPVITTPVGGTLSRQHKFTPNVATEDSPITFTVEKGSAAGGEKSSGTIVNELAFNLSRNEAALTGSAFGQLWTPGVTLAASPTVLPMKPIMPRHFDLFADTTFAGIGTTKLTADFVANFTISGRYGQIWPINSVKPSYDETVETEPQVRLALQVENNASGQAFVTRMRNATPTYLRLKATTPEFIETTIPWSYQLDVVGVVIEAPDVADLDGLYTLTIVLEAFDDGTHVPYEVTVVNSLTAL